ncbi:MAG: hypothetical protein ABJF01_05715 [bacterium]
MWYTIVNDGVPLGVVNLSARAISAAQVDPLPGYRSVEPTIRWATEALLHFGLFGVAAPRVPPLSIDALRQRRAFVHASRLQLELVGEHGQRAPTTFLNLLQSPVDGGIIAVANFMEALAPVGALLDTPPHQGPGGPGAHRMP